MPSVGLVFWWLFVPFVGLVLWWLFVPSVCGKGGEVKAGGIGAFRVCARKVLFWVNGSLLGGKWLGDSEKKE